MSIISQCVSLSFSQYSFAESTPGQIYENSEMLSFRNVTVYAPAVAQTESGNVGVISTITVTIQSHGSGRVFVDTLPLAQVDMQGSARLAVKVASALVENDKNKVLSIWQRMRRQLVFARSLYWLKKIKPKRKPDPKSETME